MRTLPGLKTVRAAVAVAVLGMPGAAFASYVGNFSAAGTQGDAPAYPGWYYFDNDSATQTFTGTGVTSAGGFDITLNTNRNTLDQSLGLTFFLNGTNIGSTTYAPSSNDIAQRSLSFNFGALSSASGSWTLLMDVTTPVCAGCGALHFTTSNPFTLRDAPRTSVPEPATLGLLGLGLLGASVARRRKTAELVEG